MKVPNEPQIANEISIKHDVKSYGIETKTTSINLFTYNIALAIIKQ